MASRSDIQAGGAFVRLYVKNNEFLKGLQASGQTLKKWGTGIAAVGGVVSGLGASILGPLLAATEHFASSGDEINKMAQRTGVSAEALSQLRYAAEQSGASVNDLETGLKHMGKTIDEARQGSKEARDTLRRLGITFDQLKETPDAQLEVFADRLSQIQDPSQRAALAMKVFGKSGTTLLPMLADGAAGIREFREEATRLGLTITQEQADAATNLGDAWEDVKKVLSAAAFAIGGALAPSLNELLISVREGAIKLADFIRNNKELVVLVAKVGIGIAVLGAAITAVGVGFIGAGAMLTGFVTVVGAVASGISAVIGIIVSGPGLIVAAVAGGIAAFAMFTETGREAVDSLLAGFFDLLNIGKSAWTGIVNAVMSGDLALAGQIALASLNLVWQQMVSAFKDAWTDAKFYFLSIWEEAKAGIAGIFISAFAGIQMAWVTMTAFIESTWESLKTNLLNGWQKIQKGIGDAIISAAEKSGAVSKEFADAWRQSLEAPIDADIAGRTAKADSRQTQIQSDKDKALAQIAADEAGAQGILDANKRASQQKAFDARNATLGSGQAAIDAARAEFDSLNKDAGIAAEAAAIAAVARRKKEAETGAGIVPPGSVGMASSGTFSSAAALALGGGGIQERIAQINERQEKLLQKGNEKTDDLVFLVGELAKGFQHG